MAARKGDDREVLAGETLTPNRLTDIFEKILTCII